MNNIEIENDVIVLSLETIVKLYDTGCSDSVNLYLFYHKQSKLQKTNQSWSTNTFCMKGLGWGKDRLYKAKKIIKDLNLIEEIVKRDDAGKIENHYVKINYMKGQTSTLPQNKRVVKQEGGNQPTNAGSSINLNAGSSKKKMLGGFDLFWKEFPHARTSKKTDAKKSYNASEYTEEEIMEEVRYLKWCIRFGIVDGSYVKGCALWIRDFIKTNEGVKGQNLKKIVYMLMKDKQPEVAREFQADFGDEIIKKYSKEYNNEFNTPIMK